MTNVFKRYVDIELEMKKDGSVIPLAIYYDQDASHRNIRYPIDCVYDVSRNRRKSQVGGIGIRYVISIHGQRRVLFQEKQTGKDRWFLEALRP